jgi:hypothetical protein
MLEEPNMAKITQRVHLADLANFIGSTFRQPNLDRTVSELRVNAVANAGFHTVVGLDSVTKSLPQNECVNLWRPEDKVAHLRCGPRCDKLRGHKTISVPAAKLGDYVGWLAFIDCGVSPGPHLILASVEEGDLVHVTVSSEELVGTIDQVIQIETAAALG